MALGVCVCVGCYESEAGIINCDLVVGLWCCQSVMHYANTKDSLGTQYTGIDVRLKIDLDLV